MLKMIKHYLKKRTLFIIVVSIFALLLSFVIVHNGNFVRTYYIENNVYREGPADFPVGFITTMACVLCTLIPILELSFKMNKVSIDQMYSLPIKREKLFLVKYLVGLIEVLIPITIISVDCFLTVFFEEHMFELKYFFPYYLCLIGLSFVLYSTGAFFFTRGNTLVDGVINIAFISFFFVALSGTLNETIFYGTRRMFVEENYFTYSPLSLMANFFNKKMIEKSIISIGYQYFNFPVFKWSNLIAIMVMVLVGLISFGLFIFLNKKDKAENCMQISNSWFSYRFMIPAYISMIIMIVGENITYETLIYILIGGFVAYLLYRRNLKFKKTDYLTFIICIVASLIISYIASEINEPTIYEMFNPNSI